MENREQFLEEFFSDKEGSFELIRELTDYVSYYQRMLERLERDTLTGLYGNNKFIDFKKEAESRDGNIGVIFFDVNGLKTINDTQGHKAGDTLIQKAAESIMITFGRSHAFRTGGDEFVVILFNCTQEHIDRLLSKWREELAKLNDKDDGIHCSISAGFAIGEGKYSLDAAIKLADTRMYEEKRRMKGE